MEYIDIKDELRDEEHFNFSLQYDRKRDHYSLGIKAKEVKLAIVKKSDYYQFLAGNIKHIFPNFNKKKQFAEVHTHYEIKHTPEEVPIVLKEITKGSSGLPFGCFIIKMTDYGPVIKEINISIDNHVDLKRKAINLYEDFKEFRTNKPKGKRARKGILLHGLPGNGKTFEISLLMNKAKEDKFRVFFVTQTFPIDQLMTFKKVLEGDDTVFVLEEITERTESDGIDTLLSFLDGETSWKNSYTIATTNYPGKLPWNIIDRPGRFKIIQEIKNPDEDERRNYMIQVGIPKEQIEGAVKATDKFSLDYLINMTQDALSSGRLVEEVVKEYKERREKVSKQFQNKLGL